MLYVIGSITLMLGVVFHRFRPYDVIAGYNTMSEDRKELVEVDKVMNSLIFFLYFNSFCTFVLAVLRSTTELSSLMFIWTVFWVSSITFLVFWVQKYDHSDEEAKKKDTLLVAVIMTSVILFVFLLMFTTLRAAKFDVNEDVIEISGMFGKDIEIRNIEDITLTTMPEVTSKISGSKVSNVYKGKFKTVEYGEVYIFVNDKRENVLVIETNDIIYIINEESEEALHDLYDSILLMIN